MVRLVRIDAQGVLLRSVRSAMIFGGFSAGLSISVILALAPAASAAPARPAVPALGQAASQDVPPAAGSEPDTLVEPDMAADPEHPDVAVVVGHDGRYPDGGAVGITHAWTRDGGRAWRHAPVPFITTAARGAGGRRPGPGVALRPPR